MRNMKFVTTLLIGIVVGLACHAQEVSAKPLNVTAYEETNAAYEALAASVRAVSDTFGSIRTLSYHGVVAPLAGTKGEHLQQILLHLEGGEGAEVENLGRLGDVPDFLTGEGGRLSLLAISYEAYVRVVWSYASTLSSFYGSKCGEDFMPIGCSSADGALLLDSLLETFSTLAERVPTLAKLALDAARGIDLQGDPCVAANGFVMVYACAATAEGYWPMLAGGSLPSPQTLPSTLHDFLNLLERIHADLTDAITHALYES